MLEMILHQKRLLYGGRVVLGYCIMNWKKTKIHTPVNDIFIFNLTEMLN